MKNCSAKNCYRKFYQNRDSNPYCKRHYTQLYYYNEILERTIFDPNEIIIKGASAEIVLYNNKNKEVARAIIDVEDIEKVKKYKWHFFDGRVGTNIGRKIRKIMRLQHLIVSKQTKKGQDVDHRDGNPLNNRRKNLRLCTHAENLQNRGKQKNNTSGYKGIYKNGNGWSAEITANKKKIRLGTFKNKISAAKAYIKAAAKYHGEFAKI